MQAGYFSQGTSEPITPAANTITPPAYVLFPFADQFDGEDMLSTPRFPPLPAPPDLAPIRQPGSLPVLSVVMDTSPAHNASLSPVPMASADSAVEPVLAERSAPLDRAVREVCSSVVVSSAAQSNRRSLSPGLVQSDGSFYSATDSPTGQAPVIRHSPSFGLPLGREGPFVAANPHPQIGDDMGGCAYRFRTYRESVFADYDGQFGLPLHHPRFLEWVGAPESARLLGRDPS